LISGFPSSPFRFFILGRNIIYFLGFGGGKAKKVLSNNMEEQNKAKRPVGVYQQNSE
jgi:hypothetical protein